MSSSENQVTAQRISETVNLFKLVCVNSILFRAQEMTRVLIVNKRFQHGPLDTCWVNSLSPGVLTLTATAAGGQEQEDCTLVNVEVRGEKDVCFWASETLAIVCEQTQSSLSSASSS